MSEKVIRKTLEDIVTGKALEDARSIAERLDCSVEDILEQMLSLGYQCLIQDQRNIGVTLEDVKIKE